MFTLSHSIKELTTALTLLAVTVAQADVALVRQLEGPSVSGGNLFSDTRSNTNYGQTDRSWNPSFRTASASDAVYMVGWSASDGIPNPNYDGFITKLDPAGAEVWSKSMREIMGTHAGSRGWKLDDIKVLNSNLYVCGQKTDGDAFIAKITSNGTLLEYSLIVADSGGDVPTKETTANSLAVSVVNGQETIVLVGNVTGYGMVVSERQVEAPNDVFGGLVLRCKENSLILSDAYVVKFDNSLRATWATTLGFQHSSDYATAVEIDPLGSIFLALQFEGADRNGGSRIWWIADNRKVFFRDLSDGVTVVTHNVFPAFGYDFQGVSFEDQLSWSALFRLDPSDASLIRDANTNITGVNSFKGLFYPSVVESAEAQQRSENRIKDIVYSDGSLYIAGEWKGSLRPYAKAVTANGFTERAASLNTSQNPLADGAYDIFVAQLDALSLADSQWRFYQSSGNAYASELTVSSEGVYLSGVANGNVSHRSDFTASGTGTSIGGSSSEHLIWAKMNLPDLTHSWDLSPIESGSTYTNPTHQRSAGIGFLNNTVILTGYWRGGAIHFGEVANDNIKTLSDPPSGEYRGFAGFVGADGAWINEVQVRINSEFGQVTPHRGIDVVAAGRSIVASVPPVVYENAAGTILDPEDEDLISSSAVTRRINTGYQFKNSNVNGTVNTVTFEATSNVELTFLWRTEHAIDIFSDIDNIDGLTSTAAGNPSPQVKKHWFPENEPFTAFIDGAATNSSDFGTRWRAIGYVVTGSVASANDVDDGFFVGWQGFEDRQQTPAMVVGGPGSITHRWEKEHSIRVGVNSSVASAAPTLSQTGGATKSGTGEFWFATGSEITADSAATVTSGLSDLSLQGYLGASGSITPPEGNTAPDPFTLDAPTSITWNYGPTIYKQEVTIGDPVDLSLETLPLEALSRIDSQMAPETGSVLRGAPSGSSWADMFIWDPRNSQGDQPDSQVFPIRPGVFTLEFENTQAPDDAAKNIIIEVTAIWPRQGDFSIIPHILEAPGVDLDPSIDDNFAFIDLAYSEGDAEVDTNGLFATRDSGRSVLVFSERTDGAARGNLQQERVSVKVVDSDFWKNRVDSPQNVTIGSAITDSGHNLAEVGHNGYVLNDLAPVNTAAYDRANLSGSIFPINVLYPEIGRWQHLQEGRIAPGALAVAWYRVQDSIRWPYKAVSYEPEWPGETERIVIASRLGSEGLLSSQFLANGMDLNALLSIESPRWRHPNLDLASVSQNLVHYEVTQLDPLHTSPDQVSFTTSGWLESAAYIYEDAFDPQRPMDNLVAAAQSGGDWQQFGSISSEHTYYFVLSQYGSSQSLGDDKPYGLSLPGTGIGGTMQDHFFGSQVKDPVIYAQADPNQMGYNPNEEHALIAPAFLNASRPAAFALKNNLNLNNFGQDFTSAPYTLVQYEDVTDSGDPVIKMKVYEVVEEDSNIDDARLPEFNQSYTYLYENEAGQRLLPPYPLDLVIGGAGTPEETSGINVDDRVSYFEDKNSMPWVVSGDTDTAVDIEAVWYYPKRADFWHPAAQLGEAVAFGDPSLDTNAHNIEYNTVWPEDVAVLKAGETLTFAGGEYATDNSGETPAPKGLPQAVAWQSGEIVFDEINQTMTGNIMPTNYLARLIPVLEAREVSLALSALPVELTPASGDVTVEGLFWHFDALPANLKERIYYDTNKQVLGVRGLLNGNVIGDSDLLATPGAQTILQPNVLTAADQVILRGISVGSEWLTAVDSLVAKSNDPNDTGNAVSFMPGLVRESDTNELAYQSAFGPGLAIVTNPKLQDPSATGAFPEGFLTVAENNDPELSTPVAMHVIRVSREKYRGSIAVLEPDNVFDEKLSLKHVADFGGNVEDLYFEWYYREEDGRDLNPPGIANPTVGVASGTDWTAFGAGRGLNTIQMQGTGPILIRDNLFFCRYGFSSDGSPPTEWSAYAGAANSREPDGSSPSVATDIAYVAQLASGWIKRVTNAVNAFDARFNDFTNNDAPATYTSMLQQAGQRHEGAVAFNPDKDAIENVGLIELYQTVLDRAEDLTIDNQSGTSGVNVALLNAANRIASLYVLLGNEAYADALDPTIGYSTQSGDFGSLAPTIHAFENVTANLLEEELALLRGRSEVGARPSYNRLIWNFTNGSGEAAYVMNYDIDDLTEDGFIDDADARRLYPQGHGDAWGHYTMALTGYYRLAQIENFTWEPRSEKYNIDGNVLDVDYLDERAFAKAAAARAQSGAEIVDLVYRQKYTENPNGQWQGYTDTNTDRAWGVFETAQRSGTAALYDWMMGNAILKGEETDTSKTGIRKVDRSTVGELAMIAVNGQAIQSTLNRADGGMNPAGLDPNVVPFDIDPVRTDRRYNNPATHFEQIYERAVGAAQNALRSFEHANEIALRLRETEASSEELRKEALDQDLSYRNELIELFGTPHDGMIGAGKAYPAGYKGPDLYLFLYVDQVAAGGDILPDLSGSVIETTIVPGLRNLAVDTNPFEEGGDGSDDAFKDTVSAYFPADLSLPTEPVGEITLNLPRAASGYALVAPDSWGARRSPGAIQAAIQELVQSEWQVRVAISKYESQADDFQNLLKKFELISGIAGESIEIVRESADGFNAARSSAENSYLSSLILGAFAEFAYDLGDAIAEFFPESAGTSVDPTSPARGASKTVGSVAKFALLAGSISPQLTQYKAEIDMEVALADLDRALVTQDRKIEIVELLFEINDLVNAEGDALLDVITALETMRASANRVASTIERGQALIEQRTVFNQRVAATTTKQRYEDYTFRVFHNEALRKYRSSFDLATRYAYLAGKAYQYELNLSDNHPANAGPILSSLMRERTLGEWDSTGQPVIGQSGVAEHLAVLKANFDTLKGQLGFNNPTDEVFTFSLRRELERVGMSNRVSGNWRTALENYRVPDLWNYEYQNNGVNYGYVFRRYCRPFATEAAGAQPALVIPFTTTIEAGKNWFGEVLSGGDSSFNSSDFSTKIRAVGVRFDGYNGNTLSQTPQVYLVPVGADKMYLPNSNSLESRSWNVVDQRIPAPLPITSTNLNDPDWQPYSGSANGFFEDIRKFSSFRAYNDAGGWSEGEMLNNGRHVGRSVWNTQWVLIIPNASLLYDSDNTQAGIDTLIYGAPLPTYTQSTAGTTNRDLIGIEDIRILIDSYSISGN